MKTKILIFDTKECEKEYLKTIKLNNAEILMFEESLNEKTLSSIPQKDRDTATVISVFICSSISEDVIKEFPNLKLVATRSTGLNHINIEGCKKHGIVVSNVPSYGHTTIAQFTLGLIIELERKIYQSFLDLREMKCKFGSYTGRDLNRLTLGIIGTGDIGIGVCKIAKAIGMNIIAYDILPKTNLQKEYNFTYTDFEYLIQNSDIITLHVPYTDNNYHMISYKEFEQMKDTSYFINTSRGELVDTFALYSALVEKKIAGCALDVIECEDICLGTSFEAKIENTGSNCLRRTLLMKKIMTFDNVIITPHIAYNTTDAIIDNLKHTLDNIEAFIKNL